MDNNSVVHLENMTFQSENSNVSLSFDLNNVTRESLASHAKTSDCDKYYFIMNALVKFILLLFGCGGNSLSIAVMWSERSISATAFLLIVLAVVDTLLMFSWFFLITAPGELILVHLLCFESEFFF